MSSHSENGGNTGIDPKVARISRFDPMQKKRTEATASKLLLQNCIVVWLVLSVSLV